MMSAPREMRCRLMSIAFMLTKTMASTSGIDRATTTPALIPRLRKLTTRTMAIASKSALVKPPRASLTTAGWSETRLNSMPIGRRCIKR